MFALTVVVVESSGPSLFEGALFKLPLELRTSSQVRQYAQAPVGWSKCQFGYSIYAFIKADGAKVAIPGLILTGESRPRKRFAEYKFEFNRGDIEKFAKSIVEESDRVEQATSSELQALTHDLRAISADIGSTADLIAVDIESKQYAAAEFRIKTLLAAQQILSIRLDIVDFSTGQFWEQEADKVPVYKKIHKVLNCLKPRALKENIDLVLQGPSQGCTFGPGIFELIPFVLIQNAVKYSPADNNIVIKVADFDKTVEFHVQSLGPRISSAETESIFERGVRGVGAVSSGKGGSGLGLFAAKKLMQEGFGGSIGVIQDSFPARVCDRDYYRTTFTGRVPRIA